MTMVISLPVSYTHLAPVCNWAGDVSGVLAVDLDASEVLARRNKQILMTALSAVGGIVLAGIIAYVLARTITVPVESTVEMLKDISEGEGDLRQRLDILSSDEVGNLAKHFNVFTDKLQGLIGKIAVTANEVAEMCIRDSQRPALIRLGRNGGVNSGSDENSAGNC